MSTHSTINENISIKLNEAVGSASISPSGRDVCLAARKGLFIVDLDDPWATPRFLPYYSAIVSDVQWSPHPSRAHWVVSTSGNKGLVWNLSASSGSSPIEHVTQGHERSITDMNWAVFQPDTLATCGIDGNVLAYDLRLGGKRPVLKYCGWGHGATQVKYNRQNPNELASAHGEYLYLWDDRKGSHPVTTIRAHEQKIYGIDYSRKKKDSIVTCSLDHTVKYWTLNGLETIEEPTQTITTSSPVWRARHTPFGSGLVTLPQRSEFAVKIWAQDAPEKEVWKQSGHSDVVREFLWRTQGGDDPNDDDRVFQLVTWGNDQQLLLTPISQDVLTSVGHVPHSPIEVRQTRRHAANISYREPASLPKTGSCPSGGLPSASGQSGPGVSPTSHFGTHSMSNGSSDDYAGKSRMITGGLHSLQTSTGYYSSPRLPLSATSRYGRSANSGTSMSPNDGKSPSLGTSPASGTRGLYLSDRKADSGPPPAKTVDHGKPFSQLQNDQKNGTGTFMTRTTGKRPGGQDTVTWMEGVRVVSAGQNGQHANTVTTAKYDSTSGRGKLGHDLYGEYTVLPGGQSVPVDKEVVPLHEELTTIARALQSKVRFEKIAIPNRTLVVALYGPWAASGVSTFLRATFTFPLEYPHSPLNIDIERSSSISNKARARILAGVRGLAARYANKSKNSLETCLNCLMGGKVVEPDDLDEEDGDLTQPHGELSNFLAQRLHDGEEEVDEADSEEDLERLLANRNCPSPRRAGAVFSPTGILFAFFPLDSVQHVPGGNEKRGRSASPMRSRSRPRRRRLFESFGIIPSLQYSNAEDIDDEEEGLQNGNEEDSDEVLNIPSLLMARRRGRSHAGSESVGTSNHLNIQLAGTGRAFNSRIYRDDYGPLVGIDMGLVSQYTLKGDLLSIITANTSLVKARDSAWLVQRAWSTLLGLAETSSPSSVKDMLIRGLFLGESMPEKLFADILDVFFRTGDVQMTGLLACLVELDRRTLQGSRSVHSRKFSRSPGNSGVVDYFSLKPTRSNRGSGGPPGTAGSDYRHAVVTPSGTGLQLKSPKDWLISASYGTQPSSAGSSTRGSSWANNLSTFFKGSTSDKGTYSKNTGRNTPPSVGISGQPSPASLSPAFVKRSTIGPLSELKKQGGIASGRPHIITGKPKATSHVSFAAASDSPVHPSPLPIQKPPSTPAIKIVVRKTNNREPSRPPSLLLNPQVQAQLEYYRLLYADLLHRLQLPHQRVQVLKLTRSVLEGTNKELMRVVSGLSQEGDRDLSLEQCCIACGQGLVGRHPAYCSQCRRKREPAPCSICHLPLDGLIETCLACFHSCHLACLQDWRADEVMCPAACGCSCTDFTVEADMTPSFTHTFKSPPFVT